MICKKTKQSNPYKKLYALDWQTQNIGLLPVRWSVLSHWTINRLLRPKCSDLCPICYVWSRVTKPSRNDSVRISPGKHPWGDNWEPYWEFASIHENKHEFPSTPDAVKVATNTVTPGDNVFLLISTQLYTPCRNCSISCCTELTESSGNVKQVIDNREEEREFSRCEIAGSCK